MAKLAVLSLGGSIIAPNAVNSAFLKTLDREIHRYLAEDKTRKIIMVCGGGGPARTYQNALRTIRPDIDTAELDWLGIRATYMNGQLIKALFSDLCTDNLITDPTGHINFQGQVLVAAGWKPGFSTDYDATVLAERFEGKLIINLSNIPKVFTDDPRINPEAKPLDRIDWPAFRAMVGESWTPGKSTPFDPIASRRASELGMKVICADGTDIKNTMAILRGEKFVGTIIG